MNPEPDVLQLEATLKRSEQLQEAIETLVNGAPLYPGIRAQVAGTACSLSFEYAMALRLLIRAACLSSAFSMQRLQFEALTRGMWLQYSATDAAVEKLIAELSAACEKEANKLPLVSDMVKSLVRRAPPTAHQMLSQFKEVSCAAMNLRSQRDSSVETPGRGVSTLPCSAGASEQ